MKQAACIGRCDAFHCLWVVCIAALAIHALAAGAPAQQNPPVTDSDITSAVDRALLIYSSVNANTIDVETIGGVVTLTGTASNLLSKERAPMIAEAVRGVRSVVNRIEVTPVSRTDEEIRTDVEAALMMDPATDLFEAKVSVAGGTVELSGTVDSWQEKELTASVAKGVKGVKEVRNEVQVVYKENRPDAEILADVKAALKRDVWIDDLLLDATVSDGKVTLTGTAGSAAEKSRATSDAYVVGVKEVDASAVKVEPWFSEKMRRPATGVLRTDQEIEDAIKDALLFDPRVNSFNPTVSVRGRTATLSGVVDNAKAKRAAEQDAWNTAGVSRVVNLLKVRREKPVPDEQLEANVSAALARDPYVDRHDIKVAARDGFVYLEGTVKSFYEKMHAEDVALRVKGAVSIYNHLQVADPSSHHYNWPYSRFFYEPHLANRLPVYAGAARGYDDEEIKENIESELFWSPFVDAEKVKVSVNDGVATLSGTVDGWPEYEAAVENAYEGGATRVIAKLKRKE